MTDAKRAFGRALGGGFGEDFVFFGLRIAGRLEAVMGGQRAGDPAIAALARGDLRAAQRRFRQRGGVEGRYGQRLVRCILTRGGEE